METSDIETARKALAMVAAEWDAEYERLTEFYGAYKQMKVRAAYRLGSMLLKQRAETFVFEVKQ